MNTILFWNIRKKPILDRVARIAGRYGVDVLVLAECDAEESDVLAALAEHAGTGWHHPPSVPSKLKVFSHLPVGNLTEVFSTANERLTIRETKSVAGTHSCSPRFILSPNREAGPTIPNHRLPGTPLKTLNGSNCFVRTGGLC